MNILKVMVMSAISFLPLNAQALIIADVISVNDYFDIGWRAFDFDLTKHGYNHLTDTITSVEISYDFTKLVDPVDDPNDMNTWESIQRNSYIFDGRINYADINPGIISDRISWTKDESYCQFENDWRECELNLDLFGNAREFLAVYSENIWLGDVIFSVEVTRLNVTEPSPLFLIVIGLSVLMIHSSKKLMRSK